MNSSDYDKGEGSFLKKSSYVLLHFTEKKRRESY